MCIRDSLTGAYLTDAYLTDADLTRATLTRATLTGATLTGADLTGAYLTDADLTRATLTRATLTDAYLTDANLSYANLSYAYLSRATLSYAILSGADLSGADLTGAMLNIADRLSLRALQPVNLTEAAADIRTFLAGYPLTVTQAELAAVERGLFTGTDYHSVRMDGTRCGCLAGIAEDAGATTVTQDAMSAREQAVYPIGPGDTPANNSRSAWLADLLRAILAEREAQA